MPMIFPPPVRLPLPFRLRTLGLNHVQEPIRRPQGFPAHHWMMIRRGELVLGREEVSVAKPGDGLYLAPDEPHEYRSAGKFVVVDWVTFDGSGVDDVLALGPVTRTGVYRLAQRDRVNVALERAWTEASRPHATGYALSACVYDVLMALNDEATNAGAGPEATLGRLEPVLEALRHQPARPWTVPELAALLGQTPQSLGRQFRAALGVSPLEYLLRLRMSRAQNLLAERPDLRVHEVALAAGFPDANYFTRLFRERLGMTPGAFRALHLGLEGR